VNEHNTSRLERIRADYGTWAPAYDWFARATASIGGIRAACVDQLNLEPGATVVEFGCGPGVNFPALRAAVGSTGRVIGIDVTKPMIDRARSLIARRDWDNVEVICADATTPPIDSVDAVVATFVTSLFDNPQVVVSEWCHTAETVVVANFVPGENAIANVGLWAFTRLNARLFDLASDTNNALTQLATRTAASRHALETQMDSIVTTRHLFGTIVIHAGRESTNEAHEKQ
jgi:SAM-dependent methyltransferase